MTGGYLPMAATLTTQAIFDSFLGDYADFRTFFHGHSFTGNALGAAASLASVALLSAPAGVRRRRTLEASFQAELELLWPGSNWSATGGLASRSVWKSGWVSGSARPWPAGVC